MRSTERSVTQTLLSIYDCKDLQNRISSATAEKLSSAEAPVNCNVTVLHAQAAAFKEINIRLFCAVLHYLIVNMV